MQFTEHQLDDAIAATYMRDVTTVVNSDRRMYKFALHTAAKAKGTGHDSETDRAEAVGENVKGAFVKYLTEAQQEDPTGRLVAQFLAHVPNADLGFYYLDKEKERWDATD